MKKRIAIVLCLVLVLSVVTTTNIFAAKAIKAKSVSVAPKAMTLSVGDVVQLSATKKPSKASDKLKWSSSNKKIATVTNKGLVMGISEGKVTITVKTSNKKTAKCKVTVKNYTTEENVQELIKQNTYTKSEIDEKFKDISDEASSDFQDGEELSLISGQKLPITMGGVTIKSISIKKYHDNSIRDNTFTPYMYKIEMEGSVTGSAHGFTIQYLGPNKENGQLIYYDLTSANEDFVKSKYSEEGSSFKFSAVSYWTTHESTYFYVMSVQ